MTRSSIGATQAARCSTTTTIERRRREVAAGMRERVLQDHVRQLSLALGALFYHTHDSRRSDPGFPDCVILFPGGRLIFAELKTQRGKESKAQREWIDRLVWSEDREVYVWRPSLWLDGTIERILRHGPQAVG